MVFMCGMKKRKLGKRYREMDAQIVVALVGGGFAVLVALISKIGSDNKKDHGQVHQTLGRIEEKIDNHVENHS
jgi:hypothetical protein